MCRIDDLRFTDSQTLGWGNPGPGICESIFDVATGDLRALHAAGDFSAAACLENDLTESSLQGLNTPSSGQAFWYLTRIDGDSWNGPSGQGVADRDTTLVVVKPATVIAWHRKGFRLYWRWKSRKYGRPVQTQFGYYLIQTVSRAD